MKVRQVGQECVKSVPVELDESSSPTLFLALHSPPSLYLSYSKVKYLFILIFPLDIYISPTAGYYSLQHLPIQLLQLLQLQLLLLLQLVLVLRILLLRNFYPVLICFRSLFLLLLPPPLHDLLPSSARRAFLVHCPTVHCCRIDTVKATMIMIKQYLLINVRRSGNSASIGGENTASAVRPMHTSNQWK